MTYNVTYHVTLHVACDISLDISHDISHGIVHDISNDISCDISHKISGDIPREIWHMAYEWPEEPPKHIQKLKIVMSELPAFWAILDAICLLENRSFVPDLVSRIVLTILEIRHTMFDRAVHRDETDYTEWNGREHATMCYPNLKLFRNPKKVKVNSKIDKDLCEKHFHSNSDFTAGIFSIGCACEYNTTLGMYHTKQLF